MCTWRYLLPLTAAVVVASLSWSTIVIDTLHAYSAQLYRALFVHVIRRIARAHRHNSQLQQRALHGVHHSLERTGGMRRMWRNETLSPSLAPATFLMTRVLALAASHLLPPSSPLLRESLGYVPAMA